MRLEFGAPVMVEHPFFSTPPLMVYGVEIVYPLDFSGIDDL